MLTEAIADRAETARASEVFETEWATYRKVVDNNYLFHSEVYSALRAIVVQEAPRPFHFLDIACGDARECAKALAGTALASYDGIDLSAQALELAQRNLADLACPVGLHRGDLRLAIERWNQTVDVAWIGLSLHHFPADEKLRVLRAVNALLPKGGLLLIYENVYRGDESRDAWMARWDSQRASWTACSDAEWAAITGHVHASDFPETEAQWQRLGGAAGFDGATEIFRTPTELFAMYRLRKTRTMASRA
jgi:ubiquinone/menaquinone biosynthesis C-methylase UbiE